VNSHPHRDLILINTAGFLRSLGVGLTGVVLGIYLFRAGISSRPIGLVVGAGLAGSSTGTAVVTFAADRLGRTGGLRRIEVTDLLLVLAKLDVNHGSPEASIMG
jgi:MFS family permease